MLLRHLKSVALCALCLCGATVFAQSIDFERPPTSWQDHLDLHTSAAASSVVLHYRCAPERAQDEALQFAGERLQQVIAAVQPLGVGHAQADAYVRESYRTKVSALWQSSQGTACAQQSRLKALAAHLGYRTPR